MSEVELFLRLTRARILAVTGTKGKTTTASLVAAMLEARGHAARAGRQHRHAARRAAIDLGAGDWAVLELSELQLPTISRGADVAFYTNIGADHLDRHGTRRGLPRGQGPARRAEVADGHGSSSTHDDPGCLSSAQRLPR